MSHRLNPAPLRTARLLSLALACAFAIVAASVGLNAAIQAERDKARYRQLAPPGVSVDIDISDVFITGCCATVASALIAVLTFVYAILSLITTNGPSSRSLCIQAILLSFLSVMLVAPMVPFMLFFATRSAVVKAYIGDSPVPDELLQSMEKSLGVSGVYKLLPSLKLVAIFPWMGLLFTLITICVLFAASKRSITTVEEPVQHLPLTFPDSIEKEKENELDQESRE